MNRFLKNKITLFAFLFLSSPLTFSAPHKPSILSSSSADTSKSDSILSTIVSFVLDIAIYGSIVAMVISLILMIPVIGKKDQGLAALKGGGIVFLVAILFDSLFLPLLSKFF